MARAGRNPLVDYLLGGAEAGRNPNPYFYSQWYVHQYPDAAHSGLNPLVHFLEAGEREGYQTNPSGVVPRRPIDVAAGAAGGPDSTLRRLLHGQGIPMDSSNTAGRTS